MFRLRMIDDQNQPRTLFPLARAAFGWTGAEGWSSGVDPGTRRRLRRAVRGAAWSIEMAGPAVTGAIVAAAVGVVLVFGLRPFGLIFHTPAIVAGLTLAVLLGQLWALSGRCYARRVTAYLLAERLCPSCGYELPRTREKLAVCPECGAGWMAERVGLAVGQHPEPRVLREPGAVGGRQELSAGAPSLHRTGPISDTPHG